MPQNRTLKNEHDVAADLDRREQRYRYLTRLEVRLHDLQVGVEDECRRRDIDPVNFRTAEGGWVMLDLLTAQAQVQHALGMLGYERNEANG